MTRRKITVAERQQLLAQAKERCSYCRSPYWIGIPMVIDHIIPLASGGNHDIQNLCLACYRCNQFKSAKVKGFDSIENLVVRLFHPHEQSWIEHFEWSDDGTRILGKTAHGRVTVSVLRLNNDWIVSARRIWTLSGWHPPLDE